MWDPWDTGQFWHQRPAFTEKVPIPSSAPCDQPLVCMSINRDWMPLIIGALTALAQPSTWDSADPAALSAVLANVQDLIDAIGSAVPCSHEIPADGWPPGTQQACNIAGYIATALIHDVVDRIVQGAQNDQSIVSIIAGLLSIIPGIGQIIGGILKALYALNNAINGPNLADFQDALGDPTLFGNIACAIYGCISADGQVTDGNFDCIIAAVGSVSYAHADVITAIAIYLGQIGASGLQALQIPGVVAEYDCSGCGGGGHVVGPPTILPYGEDAGSTVLTILIHTASKDAAVSFDRPFPVPPIVTVSCANPLLIASVADVTETGFTLTIASAFAVLADTTAECFWIAALKGISS